MTIQEMSVLANSQVDHFRTFGFVVLRGLLSDQLAEALRAEVDAALRDAYSASYDERVVDGISGHYLPMASALTPLSTSLICDDPVFIDSAEQLLAAPVLPAVPEGVLYFHEAGWHNDDGIGVRGLKFATYFDPLCAPDGALRFIPCSHHLGAQPAVCTYQRARFPDYPGVAVITQPGDVIAFDLHTFHASFGGRDRLAWAIEYLTVPEDDDQHTRTLRWMADSFDQEGRGFDRDRYPLWRDWTTNPGQHPRRKTLIERMRGVGVLDLPGAETGSESER